MEPLEFLETAKDLLAANRRESDRRSSISRAYYGVYLTLRDAVKRVVPRRLRDQCTLGESVSHAGLILCLQNCTSLQSMGNRLKNLKAVREKADYNIETQTSLEKASQEFENAQELLKMISDLGGPDQVADTLRTDLEQTYGPKK